MEDCPGANRGAAATAVAAAAAAARLPEELILEILSRLPATSVHRFKCVSKRWRDLIADPLHQKRFPQTLEGFFCSDGVRSYGRFISLPGRPAPHIDPSFSFLTKQPEMENIKLLKLLDSCNGLVLFEHRLNLASKPSYAVCNPATEEWVAVPSSGVTSSAYSEVYLVFDPVASRHFHLVRICPLVGIFEVRAYSSETRGWSKWSDCVRDRLVNVGWGTGRSGRIAFANGMMYFFMTKGAYQIAALGREGKPSIVLMPEGNVPLALFVAQSQGPLHCLSRHGDWGAWPMMTESGLSIWVLEDYDAGDWVLKHSVSFSELPKNMCNPSSFSVVTVVSIHPDCDRVFFIRYYDFEGDRQWKLLSYYMHSKEVHAIHNSGQANCDTLCAIFLGVIGACKQALKMLLLGFLARMLTKNMILEV